MADDDVFQQDERALFAPVLQFDLRQLEEAGEDRRDLDDRKSFPVVGLFAFFLGLGLVFLFFPQMDDDIQALVSQPREGAAAVNRHRGQDREEDFVEIGVDVDQLLGCQVGNPDKPDARLFQLGEDRAGEAGILPVDKVADLFIQHRQELLRRQAGGVELFAAGFGDVHDPGHPDHHELVEVGGSDRQKRIRSISGFSFS